MSEEGENDAEDHFSDFELLAQGLRQEGHVAKAGFLGPGLLAALRTESLDSYHRGEFRHAAVGRGKDRRIRPEIRNDRVLWLERDTLTPRQNRYLDHMEALRIHLNRRLYLGLEDFHCHFAVFPKGSFYRVHLDQLRETRGRIVTAVLYLNEAWEPEDGGILRLYPGSGDGVVPPAAGAPHVDILPEGGTLVLFMSGEHYHEVLPAGKERLSITGWFERRD